MCIRDSRNSAVSQSKQPDYLSVLGAMLLIIQRQVQVAEAKACDGVHLELAASFVSYIYVLSLSYIGLLGLNKGSYEFNLLKEYRWLLRYGKQNRVVCVRWCIRLVGYWATTRLLGLAMHREQKRITPVSYTHLDVYKRQAKKFMCRRLTGTNACSCRLRLIRENYPSSLLLVRCGCLMGRMVHFSQLLAVSI